MHELKLSMLPIHYGLCKARRIRFLQSSVRVELKIQLTKILFLLGLATS